MRHGRLGVGRVRTNQSVQLVPFGPPRHICPLLRLLLSAALVEHATDTAEELSLQQGQGRTNVDPPAIHCAHQAQGQY